MEVTVIGKKEVKRDEMSSFNPSKYGSFSAWIWSAV